jgi:hypothetical protein
VDGRRSIAKRWRQDPAALGISPSSRSLRLLGDRRELEELGITPQAIERLGRRGEQELWRVPLGVLRP